MNISFHINAWEDYQYFISHNKNISNKINKLIKDISRSPFEGIGKPETLKNNLSGMWSRRITQEHRLVYRVKDNEIHILQCRYHYE